MKIALAQIYSRPGDITHNLEKHLQWTIKAFEQSCDLIIFPEMSLTGYLTKRAGQYAFTSTDFLKTPFAELQDAALKYNVAIMVGAPISYGINARISLIFFEPGQHPRVYDKQYLHSDEKPYFESGTEQTFYSISDKVVAPAICYESFVDDHIRKATDQQPFDLYLSSVAKPENALADALENLANKAQQYNLPVAFVNAVGPTDDFYNGGKSAVWNTSGEYIKCLDDQEETLLIFNLDECF